MVGGSNECPRVLRADAPKLPPGPSRSSEEARMSPSPSRRSRKGAAPPKPTTPARPFVAHHLSPPHEILSEAETQKVLAELKTTPERLPKIFVSDPGLKTDPKYAGLKDSGERLVGRLVRIRRPSATAGEAIAYRLVVAAAGGE